MKMNDFVSSFSLALTLCSLGIVQAVNKEAEAAVKEPLAVAVKDYTHITEADKAKRMKWWRDARFGVFIHFGPYAVMGGEYKGKTPHPCAEWIMNFAGVPASEYRENAKQLTLSGFNAEQWAQIIADAGAKYVVITSKHHDGFAMFDSALTQYDIKDATPYAKDFMKELSEACKKKGIRFCTYYSVLEWDNPALGSTPNQNKEKYLPYMKGHLAELIAKYDTDILWFDGEWDAWWTDADGREIYNYLRTLKPSILVNNRITKARQGMAGTNREGMFAADFGTPEQEVPATGFGDGVDWESCMTMNHSWGFSKNDHNFKSTELLVRHLIDTSSKGGNYLLNLGPNAEGVFPAESVQRMKEIGEWMKAHGSALYGTKASPFAKLPWGKATQKGDTYYFFVYEMPESGKLSIPFLAAKDCQVVSLASKTPCPVEKTENGLVVDVSKVKATPYATVFVMKGKGQVIDGVMPNSAGEFNLEAESATLKGGLAVQTEGGGHAVVGGAAQKKSNIGFWTKKEGACSWKIAVPKAGKYEVKIDYSCNAGTGETPIKISCGKGTLTWDVAETGSWAEYKTATLGIISLSAGSDVLEMTALAAPKEGVLNLRSLQLVPVKK